MDSILEIRNKLEEEIKRMKNGSYEQMILITVYSLSSYFKSLFTFGGYSSVTKDNLNVIKEMFYILKKERKLLNYILNNLEQFDTGAVENVVCLLDTLNDNTVEYYYNVIEDIEVATEMQEEHRGLRPKKNFPTLIQSDSYENEIIGLALNKQDIKTFLGYEDEFWEHLEDQDSSSVRLNYDGAINTAFAIPLLNQNNTVKRVRMYVPEIADLDSAIVAIKTYQKAYRIFKMIGKPYSNSEVNDDYLLISDFKNVYLPTIREMRLK